jgi:hypothetical protein
MRSAVLATLILSSAGCATGFTPIRSSVTAPEMARVELKGYEHRIFVLDVTNTSDSTLIVNRDAIKLFCGGASHERIPGGIANTYVLPPHSHHAVNVRYALAGLKHGESVRLQFDDAIYRGDQAVTIEPIELRVD